MITIALSKGRIFDETLPMLNAVGIVCTENPETSRKLVFSTNNQDVRIIIVRASDVPTYVEWGGADIGINGIADSIPTSDLENYFSSYLSAGKGIWD